MPVIGGADVSAYHARMTVTAGQEAAELVAAVRDDPARRLELAGRLYDNRPGRVSIRSYRRAEMAFMRWQANRGCSLHRPRTDPEVRGGAVNEGLLRDSWEADRLVAGGREYRRD
jgi:hypothetical protein